HGIRGDRISTVCAEMVGVLTGRLEEAVFDKGEIPSICVLMRISFLLKDVGDGFVSGKVGEPFIHPGVKPLVNGKNPLIPAVADFVRSHAGKTAHRTFTGDKGTHRIFHSAVAPLYDGISLVGIFAEVPVHVLEIPDGKVFQSSPVLCSLLSGLVEKAYGGTIGHLYYLMCIVRVGRPCKVVHIFGDKVPCEVSFGTLYSRSG